MDTVDKKINSSIVNDHTKRNLAAELIAKAKTLAPVLSVRQPDGDRMCCLPCETVAEFDSIGFFRVLQPKKFGGLELSAEILFQIEIELGRGDMSAAWVLANMGVAAFHVALLPMEAQHEVWGGDPSAKIATSNMPGGRLSVLDGGEMELSGSWRFSSGVSHADWVVLGALLQEGDDTIAGSVLVPGADISVVADWDVIGLRGTGSHAIKVEAARIPAWRFLSHKARFDGASPGVRLHNIDLYRLPLPQLLFRSISSASIGGLRGMLEAFISANGTRSSAMGKRIAEDPHVLALCGRIDAEIVSLENGLVRDFDILRMSFTEGQSNLALRRAMRSNVTQIPDRCFGLAADLFRAAGASALYRDSVFLRIFNDQLAARQHAASQHEVHARSGGAALFGNQAEDMLL